jgi:hypothetical protein
MESDVEVLAKRENLSVEQYFKKYPLAYATYRDQAILVGKVRVTETRRPVGAYAELEDGSFLTE